MKPLTVLLGAFIIEGCATTSLDELYVREAVCVADGGDCSEIREQIDQKHKREEYRKNAEMPCPKNLVAFCDSMSSAHCGKRFSRRPLIVGQDYYCVSRTDLFR